jgi:hypothetical protein
MRFYNINLKSDPIQTIIESVSPWTLCTLHFALCTPRVGENKEEEQTIENSQARVTSQPFSAHPLISKKSTKERKQERKKEREEKQTKS